MENESIQFTFTRDQMKVMCEHFMKKIDDMIDEVDAGCRMN